MQPFSAFAVTLSLALSVSSFVVPCTDPPAGWNVSYLEDYSTYYTRYMTLSCSSQDQTAFFTLCCHPFLRTGTSPEQCSPTVSPSIPPRDDGDDELPFWEEGVDDDNNTPTDAPAAKVPALTLCTSSAKATIVAAAPVVFPAIKPTPTKPAHTPHATNSAGSVVHTGGFASFSYQNGAMTTACGTVHKDTDMIAAIDDRRYGGIGTESTLCGEKVYITNPENGKSVTVTIVDDCLTCNNRNSFDLSVGAFSAIGDLAQGLVFITWSFVN